MTTTSARGRRSGARPAHAPRKSKSPQTEIVSNQPTRSADELTGDRTRLVRFTIQCARKKLPTELRVALRQEVATYTRSRHVDGTPMTSRSYLKWDGEFSLTATVVDGSGHHAAVIAACVAAGVEYTQTPHDGRYVTIRDAVVMRVPSDVPTIARDVVETIGLPVMARRGQRWRRWRGSVVESLNPHLCHHFASAPVAPPVIVPSLPVSTFAPPTLPRTLRVWISADAWDALPDDTRDELGEPVGDVAVEWEGREGFVTATVTDDEVLVTLRGIAGAALVDLHVGEERPAMAKKTGRVKAAKVAKTDADALSLHRTRKVPDADARVRDGVECCVFFSEGSWSMTSRIKGERSAPWSKRVENIKVCDDVTRVRMYGRTGLCTWDSDDAKADVS